MAITVLLDIILVLKSLHAQYLCCLRFHMQVVSRLHPAGSCYLCCLMHAVCFVSAEAFWCKPYQHPHARHVNRELTCAVGRYTPFLLRWPVRLLVLSLFTAYIVVSIVGADRPSHRPQV